MSPIELSWTAKKSGVKKCLEILPLRGGGVGPLMANAILNFHFDFLNPSLTRSKSTAVLLYILVASFQYIIPDNIEPLTPPNSREFFLKLVRFVEAFGRDCLKCLNFKKPIDDEFCFLDCKFKGPNLVTIIQSRHLFANTSAPSMD